MEGYDNAAQLVWAAYRLQKAEQSGCADQAASLSMVDERHVKRLTLFSSFLVELTYCEDHIGVESTGAEATFGLKLDPRCKVLGRLRNMWTKTYSISRRKDACVVCTVLPVPLDLA
ncbi:hypothetical protein DPMN_011938 [Dreissena polymorpha]|uniref:Uncharacterized protein n=1 Tax=Dreissena polymorpha TaxID=45954 RepID=A0A9D4N4L2_DREPO|nr:hypothetical protein DPMN_011938 [Dreissena polymorpha]